MIKIPLGCTNERITLSAVFQCRGFRGGLARINFVVDTGSPVTLLSYAEVFKLQIPEGSLTFKEQINLAGSRFNRKDFRREAILYLKTDEEKSITLPYRGYGVITPLTNSQEAKDRATNVPSILGLDFLRNNNITLVCKPSEGVAFLEFEQA